jgi:hypothetical protein
LELQKEKDEASKQALLLKQEEERLALQKGERRGIEAGPIGETRRRMVAT